MVGGFDGANSFFSLFYAFEYWWSSDTVGNDLIGGEEKQKPARTPAFVWTKEVFRTCRIGVVKENATPIFH